MKGAAALLRSSVVNVPCRLGLMIRDSAIELCSPITMGMIDLRTTEARWPEARWA